MDHSVTNQRSIRHSIEDNWDLGRLGDQFVDAKAGSFAAMVSFGHGLRADCLYLDPVSDEPTHQ